MYKQIWLYDGTEVLLESIEKYKLSDGTILDNTPSPTYKKDVIPNPDYVEVVSDGYVEVDTPIISETIEIDVEIPVEYEIIETYSFPEEYTEIQPTEGLYEPISFDGEKWSGITVEEWSGERPIEELAEESPEEARLNMLEGALVELTDLVVTLLG